MSSHLSLGLPKITNFLFEVYHNFGTYVTASNIFEVYIEVNR